MTQQTQEIVRAFVGENRLLADDLLSDNISPDAQNVDYSSGTIKKRKGFSKIHQTAILGGGVRIENATNNRCVIIPDHSALDLVDDFTLEWFVSWPVLPANNTEVMVKQDTGTTSGWWFQVLPTTPQFRFRFYNGAGALVTTSAAITFKAGETYHVVASRSGTTVTMTVWALSDGATATQSKTLDGETTNSRDVFIGAASGATPVNNALDEIVDEMRLWSDVRTPTELSDARFRELNQEEILNANLVGYWKMNEGVGSTVEDLSVNANHGSLFEAQFTSVEGLVPQGSGDDFAVRFNGKDNRGTLAYRSSFAPILDTGDVWSVEAWVRLDSSVGLSDSRILALGDFNDNCPFTLFIDSSLNLKYSYSTTTTHSNAIHDTTYNVVVGAPFHVTLVRDGVDSILTYINGLLRDTHTSVTSENGPHSLTTTGLTLGYMLDNGVATKFCPCTIDEVRVWSGALGAWEIGVILWDSEFPLPFAPLLIHLHFNAGAQSVDQQDVDAAVTFLPAEDKPVWSRGLVYPIAPEPLSLAAPLTKFLGSEDVSSGRSLVHHEVLVATRTDFWAIQGTRIVHLASLVSPNRFNDRYTHTIYRDRILCLNGLGRNYAYDGDNLPFSITLPTWTDSVTVAVSGAGAGWAQASGDYLYRFAWYDENTGIEGLFGGEKSVTVDAAVDDQVDISGIAASLTDYPNVTHVRIYRQNPGGTVFRHHSDVAIGTTTATDDGSGDLQGNDAANTRRGHPNPHKICAVYANRLFLANESAIPSGVVYSDANTDDFQSTNVFFVDRGDGDEVTGMISHFGGLPIWKQNSIHMLTGSGATTFQLRKLVDGVGCVSHNTIAPSPNGIYFLAEDGVYLFDGRSARYVSHSQQPEFLKLDRTQARNAVGVYDIATHQYIVSFDIGQQEALAYVDVNANLFDHYWKLGGASVEDSIGVAPLTAAGGPAALTDPFRGLVTLFDGSDDIFTNTTDIVPAGSFYAYGFWVYFDSIPGSDETMYFIPSGGIGGVRIELLSTGSVRLTMQGSVFSYTMTQTVIAGQWYHFVFLDYSPVDKAIVFNGQITILSLGLSIGSEQGGADDVRIGAFAAGAFHFGGRLANVFMKHASSRAGLMTPEQAVQIYNHERGGSRRRTFAYDEETQAWALWDKTFDTLVLAEQTSTQNDVLGGRNGFVHKLLHGDRDGAGFIGGGPQGGSGTLASETGPIVTDSSAIFPTAGDGLAGVEFVAVPSDTTLATQRRLILFNTATKVHLDGPLAPAVSGTYFIGPIDTHWESRWMDMGDPGIAKRWFKLSRWAVENAATVTLMHKTNEYETFITSTFSTADEFDQFVLNNRGHKIKILFQHIATDEKFEIQSFQLLFEPRGFV